MMGSDSFQINGRTATSADFQFFVDRLKEAKFTEKQIQKIADDNNITGAELRSIFDRNGDQRLTQDDFLKIPSYLQQDIRSVLDRHGFNLRREVKRTVTLVVPDHGETPEPSGPPPTSPSVPVSKKSQPIGARQEVPYLIKWARGHGVHPDEAKIALAKIHHRTAKMEALRNEPDYLFGELGCGFFAVDDCDPELHPGRMASIGRGLGTFFNPLNDAKEAGTAAREFYDEPSVGGGLYAGVAIAGTLGGPIGDGTRLGAKGVREGVEEVGERGVRKVFRRVIKSGDDLALRSLSTRAFIKPSLSDLLKRPGRTFIKGTWTPGNPDVVCGPKGRVEHVTAFILDADIGTGSAVTESGRDLIQDHYGLRHSDAGHIIGRLLGGKGGAWSNNLIPQDPTTNRGVFQLWEGQIADWISRNGSGVVNISIHYEDEAATIPKGITYHVSTGGVERVRTFGNAH